MRLATLFLGITLVAAMAVPAAAQTTYLATLTGASEVPTNASAASGNATVVLNAAHTQLLVTVHFQNLVGTYTASHIHGPAAIGVNAGVKWGFVGVPAGWVLSNSDHNGDLTNFLVTGITATDVSNLDAGLFYVNIHSTTYPGGEIRGQLTTPVVPTRSDTWGRIKQLFN